MDTSDRKPGPPSGSMPEGATELLHRVESGEQRAAEELLPLVYEQLRSTAGRLFASERLEHTLQPTAVVHEAYVKLINSPSKNWESRDHFCAVASIAMRQILTDYARARRSQKRGGDRRREVLTNIDSADTSASIDALALEETLEVLTEIDPEGARVVEMRFFGGMTHEQIARVAGVSVQVIERRWRRCRAFIRSRMRDDVA